MRYVTLNGTELSVSALCLGSALFGATHSEAFSFGQMDLFAGRGGTLIDTAHIYNDWIEGERSRSEKVIGRWLKSAGNRDDIVLLTKCAHPPMDRMDHSRVSRAEIRRDLRESLDNLGTDHVELYLLHRDDPAVPAPEIVDWMNELVDEGRVRHWGCSNWTIRRIREANEYAAAKGRRPIRCNQTMWSFAGIRKAGLADQTLVPMDAEGFAYHARTGLNLMAFTSQAKGYFARLAAGEDLPQSMTDVYGGASNARRFEFLQRAGRESGLSIAQMSLLFFLNQPFPAIPVVSYDTDGLLIEGLSAYEGDAPERARALRFPDAF